MKKLLTLLEAILLVSSNYAQNGFWGMTSKGVPSNEGVIFKTDSSGNNQSVVYSFPIINEGKSPKYTKLCQASNGKLYGMTASGGSNGGYTGYGVLFEYDPATNTFTKKIDFDNTLKGSNPNGSLMQASNGKLYGMTQSGGSHYDGVLFEYDPATNTFTKKIDFDEYSKGSSPYGSLIQASNGKLYGMTQSGGSHYKGVLFEYDPATNAFTKKIDFDGTNKGERPYGSLMQASNGKLYGMTKEGGTQGGGVLFEYDPTTNTFTKKIDFDGTNKGKKPYGSLIQAANGKLYGMTNEGGTQVGGVLFEYDPTTNTFTKKIDFDGTNKGKKPYGDLMQASNGKLYGMTKEGGTQGYGILFEYDPATNTFTKKTDFDGTNKGNQPMGSLMQASNGKLYGTTMYGGSYTVGVLFEFNPATNTFIKKLDFNKAINGRAASGSLLQASNGKLYGMTPEGGNNNKGVLFEYDPATNAFTKKMDFDGTNKGSYPYGSLMQASNGKLYGMTKYGGSMGSYGYGYGVLFEYNPATNTFTKKIDFDNTLKGSNPNGSLMQASNGKLYGMTRKGGSNDYGVIFEYDPVTNTFTKKTDFDGSNKGRYPYGSLMQASNGKLYGMTYGGGTQGGGVLFEFDPASNTFTKKIDFDGSNKGSNPFGSLTQVSNGKLYGMTREGGTQGGGVLFEYDPATNTFTKKTDFDGTNKGKNSRGSLMQASNGKLYGMTKYGGSNNYGVLFEYDPATNTFTKKTNFDGTNGSMPYGDLIEFLVSNVSFTTSQSNFTSPPFAVNFTNTSVGYNSYQWNFGDGSMSSQENPSHTYQYNGTYTVTLFATDILSNYTDTATAVITCSGGTPNPCNFTAELTNSQSSAIICVGDSFKLGATPDPSLSYQWFFNGITIQGATDSVYYGKAQGFYLAVLSKNNCSKTTGYFALANYPHSTPGITVTRTIAPCSNDSVMLSASGGFASYLWNNGKTGQNIYTSVSGNFVVNAIDNNGCSNQSQELVFNASMADIPSICAVGTDGANPQNIVHWEKEVSNKISGYKVYKESTVTGVYTLLGTVAYTDPPEFTDAVSNVAVRQYRYRIAAVDTCNKETALSNPHKTMHLMINAAPGNHWNLIWRPYEGFSYNSYNIYRGTDSSNMTKITTISSSNTSYTDLTNPAGDIYYQIEVVSTDTCHAKGSIPVSRSNNFNTKNASGLGINTTTAKGLTMNLFPNPNSGSFTLEVTTTNGTPQAYSLEVYSPVGALLHSEKLEVNGKLTKEMHLNGLSKGVYLLQLKTKDNLLTTRFVVR